jgi:hypothetical protein
MNEYSDHLEALATGNSGYSHTSFIVTFTDAVEEDEALEFTEAQEDLAADTYWDAVEVANYDADVALVEIKLIRKDYYDTGVEEDILLTNV